jgi:glutathione S-transferase
MLGLYFAPGACSLPAHIVLEESGEKYEPIRVDLAKGEQRSEAYLRLNPQGRVPVLRLDDGMPLAENTAILPYLGQAVRAVAQGSAGRSQGSLTDRLLFPEPDSAAKAVESYCESHGQRLIAAQPHAPHVQTISGHAAKSATALHEGNAARQ